MKFMLDTDAVSDGIRNPGGRVASRIATLGRSRIGVSIIVAAELRFWAVKRGSRQLAAKIDELLGAIPVLPIQPPADETYAKLRAMLERMGTPIGGNDMLIAAHALTLDCTLVTGNEREFRRIPGLTVENWLG
jgi:tRNA(fMet)-specific endonuclease VapC